MVRTAATAIKTVGGKSSKAVAHSNSNNSGGSPASSRKRFTGGNRAPKQMPVPDWQKPITDFFSSDRDCNVSKEDKAKLPVCTVPCVSSEEESDEPPKLTPHEWQKSVRDIFPTLDKPTTSKEETSAVNINKTLTTFTAVQDTNQQSEIPDKIYNGTSTEKFDFNNLESNENTACGYYKEMQLAKKTSQKPVLKKHIKRRDTICIDQPSTSKSIYSSSDSDGEASDKTHDPSNKENNDMVNKNAPRVKRPIDSDNTANIGCKRLKM